MNLMRRAIIIDPIGRFARAGPARSGEICDFAAIYRQWFRPVHRWIRAMGGLDMDAEDLAQEVFVVVQRKLGMFDGANLAGWLYRIAQFTVRDYRRRPWFKNVFLRSRYETMDAMASPQAGLEEKLARKQCETRVCELIEQLNPKWRDSFLLFELEGLSSNEIAALQGIPTATVRTHLYRARKQLMDLLTRSREGRDW
jgi:RNA polymerase sigma-70 factor, ECF subfamily